MARKKAAASPWVGLPKSIKVGPFHITVLVVESLGDDPSRVVFGDYSAASHRIRLCEKQRSHEAAVDTALHEISHSLYDVRNMAATDTEERAVASWATAWTEVFLDNPDLVKWLGQCVTR